MTRIKQEKQVVRKIVTIVGLLISMVMMGQAYTEVVEKGGLVFYYPHFSRIDLAVGTMPNRLDSTGILCAEAAYTENLEDTFRHANIDGNHVAGGVLYEGSPCAETDAKIGNTGAFVYFEGEWQFMYGLEAADEWLHRAAEHGGMGFCQAIVFLDGQLVPHTRLTRYPKKVTCYRVLAELEGRLCLIDSRQEVPYEQFIELLRPLGIRHAIYVDMGKGWNYSWYRDVEGRTHLIHPTPGRYTTNWITFY